MFVVMKRDATREDIQQVRQKIVSLGFIPHEVTGVQRTAIAITGNKGRINPDLFTVMSGVEDAIPVSRPYKLAGRDTKPGNTEIDVGGEVIGGRELAVIAGPCAVESREQLFAAAEIVREAGVRFLRGGAFKPRTSPYAFQGMKEEGLVLLREVKDRTGLKIVTEAKDVVTLPRVADVADVIQIGARNMQNYSLLEAAGDLRKPVMLKRGVSATIEELLMSAEYILARGNKNVILCERGIRTFEPYTRNTLDLNAIPVIKKISHLPIVVDPSHGIGMWDGVSAMALAGVAAGADGLLIEVHPNPESALSDGAQALKPERFRELMERARMVAAAVDRTIGAEVTQ
ncbi:MAG: 3-deoxy-7-phosphoheptulonate synthase [Bacteroidetes bacterium]|nr:3-deoxy-7-phosphoheptulonate synthase [Bacteroidota bacterium]MCW5897057.1 3-deoxy-7-phosphoheptulonate synthase [Bacteroidota bacterium]